MMSKFPDALPIPDQILTRRAMRNKQILKASILGISFRLSVIFFEFIGVFFINSSSLFLDAISSLMDVASSVFLIFCIKLAQRPPDRNHPFGHGRYEPLGGMLLGVVLMILGSFIFFQQFYEIFHERGVSHIHSLSWLFPAIATCVLEFAYRLLIHTARQENSPALATDAIHYRIDSLTSLFATVALFAAGILPSWAIVIDHGGALLIALFMVIIGIMSSRNNFHQLVDRAPDVEFFERVRLAACKASGVEGTEKIRIQQYGPDAHVDIDIEVEPHLTVDKAHEISQQVRLEIQKAWPSVLDVTVHIEPYYANDH